MTSLPLPDAYEPRTVDEPGPLMTVPLAGLRDAVRGARPPGVPGPLHPPLPAVPARGTTMGRTRRGLLQGATVAFAERGLRRTTMQHVASCAGVAKATLYNHFRTKDDVAVALLDAELHRLTGLAAALPRGESLGVLAEEVAGHPVLRRLAETEPEVLAQLLGSARWPRAVADLATALDVDTALAGTVARWLAGLVLQPGSAADRAGQAAVLARVFAAA